MHLAALDVACRKQRNALCGASDAWRAIENSIDANANANANPKRATKVEDNRYGCRSIFL